MNIEKRKVIIGKRDSNNCVRYESEPVAFANLRKGDTFKFADEPLIGHYECQSDPQPNERGFLGCQAICVQVVELS